MTEVVGARSASPGLRLARGSHLPADTPPLPSRKTSAPSSERALPLRGLCGNRRSSCRSRSSSSTCSIPLPTTDATIPAVYRNIAADPGDFAIMQLPLGWRNSFGVLGSEQTNLQYFQTAHGKPMIGGNISRAPAFKMEYFARIPLFKALTDLEMYKDVAPEVDAAARAQAGALMALYNVRYFITTPPIPGRYPYQDTWQRTEQYALDVLPLDPTPVWEADGYRVYRVNQPPVTLPFRLDLGSAGGQRAVPRRGLGRAYGRAAVRRDGELGDRRYAPRLYLPMPR